MIIDCIADLHGKYPKLEKEKNSYAKELAKKAWREIIAAIEEVEEEHGLECDKPDFIEVLGIKFYQSELE